MRILFVCTGNTCRSPLAEALLRRMATERGLTDVQVSSAGSGSLDGVPASSGTYLVGIERGADTSAHRSRRLTHRLVAESDLILTMSKAHLAEVERMGGTGKSWLLGEYAGYSGQDAEVDDPYGGEMEDYRRMADQVETMIGRVLDRLAAKGTAG